MAKSFLDNPIERRETDSWKWNQFSSDVVPMWVADMDFKSPAVLLEAIGKRLADGILGYTLPRQEHFEIVKNHLQSSYGWKVESEWIVFLPSVLSAIRAVSRMAASDGSGVIVPTPCYPPFNTNPQQLGAKMFRLPFIDRGGRKVLDYSAMDQAADAGAKWLILCNPHNPLGQVMTRPELLELKDWLGSRKKFNVISDEVHCQLILNKDCKHTPFASISKESAQATITVMAPSKTYNIPSLGIAFAIVPNESLRRSLVETFERISDRVTPLGLASLAPCYNECESWRGELLEYLRENRDRVCSALSPYEHLVKASRPEATYLSWLDFRGAGIKDPFSVLLKDARLALSNGRDFLADYHTRLNFACPRQTLEEGLLRLTAFLEELNSKGPVKS